MFVSTILNPPPPHPPPKIFIIHTYIHTLRISVCIHAHTQSHKLPMSAKPYRSTKTKKLETTNLSKDGILEAGRHLDGFRLGVEVHNPHGGRLVLAGLWFLDHLYIGTGLGRLADWLVPTATHHLNMDRIQVKGLLCFTLMTGVHNCSISA